MRIFGFSSACMIVADIERSSALSTSVTSAGESMPPHGVCCPERVAEPLLEVGHAGLGLQVPSGPKTQCRGKLLAPTSSWVDVPSVWIVSSSVVQTSGARNCTNGGWLTRRGAGIAVRPPTVWLKRTHPSPISGSCRMSGSATAWKVAWRLPIDTVVEPITQPPV